MIGSPIFEALPIILEVLLYLYVLAIEYGINNFLHRLEF